VAVLRPLPQRRKITKSGWSTCATRRPDIFPAQQGEIGGISQGLLAYLDPKAEGNNSMPETGGRAQEQGRRAGGPA
jgi:hypothetical protein